MTPANRTLSELASQIQTWGAVALVGAGASFRARYPQNPQLQQLLWRAVESDPEVEDRLRRQLSLERASAKTMLGQDPQAEKLAYRLIASSPRARRTFQQEFAKLDRSRSSAQFETHLALARLLHQRFIDSAIVLNWDTLLESAFSSLYGRSLDPSCSWLFKPHGDARDPDLRWVFPHEEGSVPDSLSEYLRRLTDESPRVLLLIGYSENDQEVVDKIINSRSYDWDVFRLNPSASGRFAIRLPAEVGVPRLADQLCERPEVPNWEYVSFQPQRDLRPALRGERLGQADVDACPSLSIVERLHKALRRTGHTVLSGDPGCGKSLAAYQAAYDRCEEGWEVLRLTGGDSEPREVARGLRNLPHKTLLLIDDAQTLSGRLQNRLLELSQPCLEVLLVISGEFPDAVEQITLPHREAVLEIDSDFRTRIQEIRPLLRNFDSRIGTGYLSIPVERRLDEAVQESSPWQYTFVLRGGWNTARDKMEGLREADRADLVLAVIAIGQLLTVDEGVSRDWIREMAEAFGHDDDWVAGSLETLARQRLIDVGDRLRTVHSRFASKTLRFVVDGIRTEEEWQTLTDMIGQALLGARNLQGVSWLLSSDLGYRLDPTGRSQIVSDHTRDSLLLRCWSAEEGTELRNAAFVIRQLMRWRNDVVEILESKVETLSKWIERADGTSAAGMADLINDLYNKSEDLAASITEGADPGLITPSVRVNSGKAAARWGMLLSRLALTASDEWVETFMADFDASRIRRELNNLGAEEVFHLQKFIYGISSLDRELGLSLTERAVPMLAEAINENAVEAFRSVTDVRYYTLGLVPRFLRREAPTNEQLAIARGLLERLDQTKLQPQIEASRQRDWTELRRLAAFIDEVAESGDKVCEVLRFERVEQLERRTAGLWKRMPDDLEDLLILCEVGWTGGNASDLLRRHQDELCRLTPTITGLAPEVVAEVLAGNREAELELQLASGLNWDVAYDALQRLRETAPRIAREVAIANSSDLGKGLELTSADQCESLSSFVELVHEIAPRALEVALGQLALEDVRDNWVDRWNGSDKERESIRVVLGYAREVGAEVARLGDELD